LVVEHIKKNPPLVSKEIIDNIQPIVKTLVSNSIKNKDNHIINAKDFKNNIQLFSESIQNNNDIIKDIE